MDGMTRPELDKAEARDAALGNGPLRPQDAATLILLDRSGGETFVLMGRRHARHAFMPGKFVFPGGRTDPLDSRVPVADGLHPAEQEKIARGTRIGAARRYAATMEPFASGAYVNVLGDDGAAGIRRAYPPDKLERLRAVKDAYDPGNVFHLNQNIVPTPG